MNSTYDNIGKSKNINLSLFLNWNMSPKPALISMDGELMWIIEVQGLI